ncbi:putative Na+-dependent transporter [Desulfitispora alkaliphila]|uniref:bile acid:sodium symporter family protein n=1 Tax=Desulfitispora alkaliphila TaxID=622674 RepID=UPI003D1952B6
MLEQLDTQLKKFLPLITPISLVIGVLLGPKLEVYVYLIPWVFAIMTFAGSLDISLTALGKALSRPGPIVAIFCILHVVMPAIAWLVGQTFFPGDVYTSTGLILAFAIPVGISSFIWVTMGDGDGALTLAVILLNTILSPLIVPYSLKFFMGAQVHIDVTPMLIGLFWMIVFPSLLAIASNYMTNGKAKALLSKKLSPFSKIGLGIVVAINSSVVASYFKDISPRLLAIAATVFFLAALGYLLGWIIASFLKWERPVLVAMVFNSGMRNITAGAVLAITYFPPTVAVPVVVGMLFQQLLASFYARALSHTQDGYKEKVLNTKENVES